MMVRALRPINDAGQSVPEVATQAVVTAQRGAGPLRNVLKSTPFRSTTFVRVGAPANLDVTSVTGHSVTADLSRRPAPGNWYSLKTRALDVAAATLVVTAPVLGVHGFLVRLDAPGLVFVHETRGGGDQRVFTIIRLRSMRKRAPDESDVDQIGADIDRITRVRWLLRRWTFDELPKILNGLHGELRIAGARPGRLGTVHSHDEGWQVARFEVPQGMAGWWRVFGRGRRHVYVDTANDFNDRSRTSSGFVLRILATTLPALARQARNI